MSDGGTFTARKRSTTPRRGKPEC